MKTTTIALSLTAVLAAAGLAVAYHHAPPVDGNVPDLMRPWEQWGAGAGLLVVTCESSGAGDPINPQLAGPVSGQGGICYASSQGLATPKEKKDKKDDDLEFYGEFGIQKWSYVQPTCLAGDCDFWNLFVSPKDDWFARVGNNAHSCIGSWDQKFLYKEALAYFHGAGANSNGISGHVTFFVNDPTLSGSYKADKYDSLADYEQRIDEKTGNLIWVPVQLDDVKTAADCSGSNWVGLGDAKPKPL